MIKLVSKITGLLIIISALTFQLTGTPMVWEVDNTNIWHTEQKLPLSIGLWQGKKFEFASWVYSYIPSDFLSGIRYMQNNRPYEMIEASLIHSQIKDYLHDPNLCSYAQGVEQKLLQTVVIPNSSVKASFSKMMVTETGERFYQLSWYQWGKNESSPSFWRWIPVSLSWPLFHKNMPQWHYYTLVYVSFNSTMPVEEKTAKETLLNFAGLLQQFLKESI